MRTTIEMKEQHRARLLEMAAMRGEKGFSHLVAEAIEAYLERSEKNVEKRRLTLRLRGVLSEKSARRMQDEATKVRESWR